jgi:hypothetical protein
VTVVLDVSYQWKTTLERYPQVEVGELPGVLGDIVRYMRPIGPMFPQDWLEMLALTFWSGAFPGVKFENLGLNLWFLGINGPGVGKNITTDELYAVFRDLAEAREQKLAIYTSGSAEGMGRRLAGHGRSLLAYHAEYAGFLRSLRQMPGAKELLCNLYDGRDIAHQLANESIEATDPYTVVVATTTMAAITESGSREDLSNGYLSRFLFCAPDSIDVGPESFRGADERAGLVASLARHLGDLEGVRRVALDGVSPALEAYRRLLGVGTGRVRDLDAERANEETPPGRLVARVKKVAGLLALASPDPVVRGHIAIVPEGCVELAIRLVQRAEAYQRRVGTWLGASRGDVNTLKVLRHLKERPSGLTSREVQQLAHINAREAAVVLGGLIEDGDAEEVRESGRKVLYRAVR